MISKKLADYILLKVVLDSFPSFLWPSKFLSLLLIKQLMKFNLFFFPSLLEPDMVLKIAVKKSTRLLYILIDSHSLFSLKYT